MSARILLVADAGPAVGGGHVMRCLTLAQALTDAGAACAFLASPEVASVLDAFGGDLRREPTGPVTASTVVGATEGFDFDGVVFDHYGLSAPQHAAAARGRPVLVIDDLADRPLGADIVLNPSPTATEADYAALAAGARLLLGPAYAPVRPAFAALREAALARRGRPPVRVLVALGLTDVGGVTERVVERLRRRSGQLALDVVLGGAAPSLPALRRIAAHDPRLTLHVDTPEMARLTLEADVAVGAGGSSTWERCVLGLPSILLVLAANQEATAAAMAQRGAALRVDAGAPDFEDQLERAIVRLLSDAGLRARLSAESAQLCDGKGAARAAGAFLQRMAQA